MCSRIDVQFRSDHLLQYAGFKLTYRVKNVSDTASNGTFDLENYIHILWEFEKSALKLLTLTRQDKYELNNEVIYPKEASEAIAFKA